MAEEEAKRKLWVATANVGGHDFDREREAQIIFEQISAPIIAMQEIKPEFQPVLQKPGYAFVQGLMTSDHGFRVPIQYDTRVCNLIDEHAGHLTGNRKPGKSFDDGAERTYTLAAFGIPGARVVVGNAHFGFAPQSIRESMKILAAEMLRFAEKHDTPYMLMLGDFNMNVMFHPLGNSTEQARNNRAASREAYEHAEQLGFKDAFMIAKPNGFSKPRGRVRTFNNWSSGEPYALDEGVTVDSDYVFVQRFDASVANVASVEVGGVMAFDHFPSVVQLRY